MKQTAAIIIKRITASILCMAMLLSIFAVAEEDFSGKPNYLLDCVFDEATGKLEIEVYITDETAIVGQLGIHYDPMLFTLFDSDGSEVAESVPDKVQSGTAAYLTKIVKAEKEIAVTAETNVTSKLVDTKEGNVYFAWYIKGQSPIDAREENKRIAAITLGLKSTVTVADIKNDSICEASKPNPDEIVGWLSGALLMNYAGDRFLSNDENAQKRVVTSVQYQGVNPPSEKTEIKFLVFTDQRAPLANAKITFTDSGESIFTDENGAAKVLLSDGVYSVKAEKDGFDSYSGTVKVSGKAFTEELLLPKTIEKKVDFSNIECNATENKITVNYTVSGEASAVTEYKASINDTLISASKNEAVFTKLQSGTEYKIYIYAYSDGVQIGRSELVSASTKAVTVTPSVPTIKYYTLKFNVGEGELSNQTEESLSCPEGKLITSFPTVISPKDKAFKGWSRDGKETVSELVMNSDCTLYAIYEEIDNSGENESEKPPNKEEEQKNDTVSYIKGYEDGTFRPDNRITRAEVAVILSRLSADFSEQAEYDCSFSDVKKEKWYYKYVAFCAEKGLFKGYEDNTFLPENEITRGEFAVLTARLIKLSSENQKCFPDVDESYFAFGSVNALSMKKIIGGYEDGTFRPQNKLTRAEAVTILNRATERKPYVATEEQLSFSDIEKHWAKNEILSASSNY